MTERHVIVVGAGVGGLAAAFDLVHRGVRVTVVEQHARPGGKIRQLQVAGQGIDSGPTVFTMRWIFEDLFREAGLELAEHLELQPAEVLARHAWPDGSRLDLFGDVARSQSAIEALAGPEDAAAYGRFAARSADIFNTLDLSFMRNQRPSPLALGARVGWRGLPALLATRPFATLWQDLVRQFRDPRLVQLFARYSTYCGSSPFAAPATLQLIAHAERAGVWSLRGGMQALADTLAGCTAAAGAQFRFGSAVRHLLQYDGRTTGVTLADGEVVSGDAVIFNGDSAALSSGLLGPAAERSVGHRKRTERSLSAVTWSMLAPRGRFPLAHHTVLFGADYADEFAAVFERNEITEQPTVYLCAQDRAESVEDQERERLFCLINAPARRLSAAQLEAAERSLCAQCDRHGIELDLDPATCVRTAPQDFADLFPATDGALYGRPTHGWAGSFSRPGARTRLPGLYLAGGSVHPGAGVPMVAMSGRLAAACVRHDLGIG